MARTLIDRILERSVLAPSGCREWAGYRNRLGYGKISVNGKPVNAHRAAYAGFVGVIPDGAHVCHKCDNRACVNPDHLFLGSASDNMLDMYQKGRHRRGPGIAGQSHPNAKLTDEEVVAIRSSGLTQKQISEKFSTSIQNVSRILNRVTFKHI